MKGLNKKRKQNDIKQLINFCAQIANGIEYLLSHNIMHGKIAANTMIVEDFGEHTTVKICDFSMYMILNKYGNKYPDYTKGTPIIRWWATECFNDYKATPKTEVWAFGVTMWEIFTLCETDPYHEISIEDLTEDAINGPERRLLHKPPYCPDEIYNLMKSCWDHDASKRPDMKHLKLKLSNHKLQH